MQAATSRVPIRRDPKPRSVRGTSPKMNQLVNARADRHYVYVNQNDVDAVSEYTAMGYEVEKNTPNGVKAAAGSTSKDGEPITLRGSVLMSIDRAQRDRIEAEGADGTAGQQLADEIEKRLIKNKGVFDPLRGMYGIRGASGQPIITVEDGTD